MPGDVAQMLQDEKYDEPKKVKDVLVPVAIPYEMLQRDCIYCRAYIGQALMCQTRPVKDSEFPSGFPFYHMGAEFDVNENDQEYSFEKRRSYFL